MWHTSFVLRAVRMTSITALVLSSVACGCGIKSIAKAAENGQHAQPILAPPLEGGSEWFNTSKPIAIHELRGKFIVLDFWTYCCINCMHVLPELKKLEEAYPNNVVVIGVHSGKFDTEHDAQAIRQAILRYEIEHPVVNDPEYKIWNSYKVNSWPTLRIIDPQGNLVAAHSGEVDFATLDSFFKQRLPSYRERKLLDEHPLHFNIEHATTGEASLSFPGKILADENSGRLFIADSNHNRIVVTSMDGKVLMIIGAGSIGSADGNFQTAQFHHPQGMALLNNTLYVADTDNHLIRKIDLNNHEVLTIAGTGQQFHPELERDGGTAISTGAPRSTALTSPWALCISGNDLFIAMAGAHQIWKMPLDESLIGPFAGNGREDIVNGPRLPRSPSITNSSSFAQPSGLATDGKTLFVADSEGSSVRAVPLTASGNVATLIGTAALDESKRLFTFGDLDGLPGRAHLQHCMDVAYHDGRVYVADTYNHKIKVIDLKTRECTTLAGSGKPGNADGSLNQPAEFFEPAGICYATGKLFAADTNNHLIRVVDLATGRVSTVEMKGLN